VNVDMCEKVWRWILHHITSKRTIYTHSHTHYTQSLNVTWLQISIHDPLLVHVLEGEHHRCSVEARVSRREHIALAQVGEELPTQDCVVCVCEREREREREIVMTSVCVRG
jgi:hypothetical protein